MNALDFQSQLNQVLEDIGQDTLSYNEDEFWLIERRYTYCERYATEKQLKNTCIALPLVRALHNGTYRKHKVIRNGESYRIPYFIHCLMVCRMLIDLQLPLTAEEEDLVLASALCHDLIEDIPFENGGREMYIDYHLDFRVYEIVKKLSKQKNATKEEQDAYFRGIQEDRLALVVKLADRGNNVEDLYNMSIWKAHEYVSETRKYFFPMCTYSRQYYPELNSAITILHEKMKSLTEIGEILVNRYEEQEQRMNARLTQLREENVRLRGILREME